MKDASTYQEKIKQLLKGMKRVRSSAPPEGDQATELLVESILQADATDKQAQEAIESIRQEYVDLNELRVSPGKDVADTVGRDYPRVRDKAKAIYESLNGLFHRSYGIGIDYMAEMPKRELRRHLDELGVPRYAAACIVLKVFGGHAIPVDDTLVEVLKMQGLVAPDSDPADVQGFLTRIIPHKDALSAHHHFRQLVKKSSKALARKRKAEEQARLKAEKKAEEEARKARKKAEAEAKAKEARKKKAAKKKASKSVKKSAKKAAKKTTKKTAKSAKKKKKSAVKKAKAKVAKKK